MIDVLDKKLILVSLGLLDTAVYGSPILGIVWNCFSHVYTVNGHTGKLCRVSGDDLSAPVIISRCKYGRPVQQTLQSLLNKCSVAPCRPVCICHV